MPGAPCSCERRPFLSTSFDNLAAAKPEAASLAVDCRGVGKAYQFYRRPIDQVKQVLFGGRKRYYDEYWALKDIGFSITKGDAVGIVGRNGSGKSTLLQILC